MKIIGMIAIVIVGIISFYLILVAFTFVSRSNACEVWKSETGRPTKFVSDFPWYFDCYTKTESGWISAYKLEQVETPNIK